MQMTTLIPSLGTVEHWQIGGRYVARFFLEAYRDLRHDLRTTKWRRGFLWYGFFFWTCGLFATLAVLGLLSQFVTDGASCPPDDGFRIDPGSYRYWASSGFFQITLGSGNLTFTQVKVIDIVWDIVAGRGGQTLLALVSWRVFQRYLTVSMEITPVTYRTFRTIFLQDSASALSIYGLIKDFAVRMSLHSKTAMTFMIATMTFTLAFPTLASAMTGYSGNVRGYVPDHQNKNFVQFSGFSRVIYVIHDGWRLSQVDKPDGNYWVVNDKSGGEPVIEQDQYYYGNCESERRYYSMSIRDECYLQNNVSAYAAQYGINSRVNTSSVFMNQTLPGPVLNISAFDIGDVSTTLYGHNLTDVGPRSWVWDNETYDKDYITGNGSCQSTGDYKWGFSFMQLFVMILLLLIWTIGIYIMYLRAHFTMWFRERGSVSGEHRAVLELAEAMKAQLKFKTEDPTCPEDPVTLTEQQLAQRITKDLNGGRIVYAAPLLTQKYSFRKGTKGWFKKEKWWFTATMISCVLVSTAWIYNILFQFFMIGPTIGLIFSLSIGTTNKSRMLLTLFWCMISSLIVIIMTPYFNKYYG